MEVNIPVTEKKKKLFMSMIASYSVLVFRTVFTTQINQVKSVDIQPSRTV